MNIISSNGEIQANESHSFHFEDGFTCDIKYELEIIEEADEIHEDYYVFYSDFSRRKIKKKRVVRLALFNINVKGEEFSFYHHFGTLIFRFDNENCDDVIIEGDGLFSDSISRILKFIQHSSAKPLFDIEKEIAVDTGILLSKTFLTSYVDIIRKVPI